MGGELVGGLQHLHQEGVNGRVSDELEEEQVLQALQTNGAQRRQPEEELSKPGRETTTDTSVENAGDPETPFHVFHDPDPDPDPGPDPEHVPGLKRMMARRQPSSVLSICMSLILLTSSVSTLRRGGTSRSEAIPERGAGRRRGKGTRRRRR
ncbi:hypothetical protein EYF80_032712 [Liparis tanakae]|uniref:Uncharacterized protein n=1 Tax=Liparis tanakae TaxID=230148 RepID=A0A4Z2GU41_9TELE|nr:hypothetical protein EYF80_032712 [Liparis tanakae]